MRDVEHVDRLRDHWWWRSGWRSGRHFYAFHIAVGEYPEVRRIAEEYQRLLRTIGELDLIPQSWLHVTLQGFGFVDEISADEIMRAAGAVGSELAAAPAPVVTLHRPVVRPEAIYLPMLPKEPLRELRAAVRRGIASIVGEERLPETAERTKNYRPHVSVAYSSGDQPAGPIVRALQGVDPAPATIVLDRVHLLEFHRDHRMYEWTSVTPIALANK